MARKATIYVSSTFEDLKGHRSALKTELERAGFDVESMERYAAFAEPPLDRCLADVAGCDALVLLLAHRYGAMPPAPEGQPRRAFSHLEYAQARRCGKPVFAFCVDEDFAWLPRFIDQGDAAQRLAEFKHQVQADHGRRLFTDPDNLAKQVLSALHSHAWAASSASSASAPPAAYRWPAHWDFVAYMADKREVFGGRDWLFDRIAAWQQAGQPRALLIRADFGVGKSALMAEYIQRRRGHEVLAWHFCLHDTQDTLHPGGFVRSLAAQLAAALPGYRRLVEADPALQAQLDGALADPGSAFDNAVLAPLWRLPAPDTPRVLVIDALDESLELDAAAARRGSLVSLLAAKAGRFPSWLLLLATSRPNPRVLAPLQHAFGLDSIDAESTENQDDLRRFVLARAEREPLAGVLRRTGQDADSLARLLVQRSQGKFLFAVRALRDLASGRIGMHELAALPPGMDSFYLDAFERRFTRAGLDYEATRRVLGALCAAREPAAPALLAEVLQVAEAEVKAVRQALPDFLRQRAGQLAFDHFSIAEWLTRDDDEGFARAGAFAVDLPAAQQQWRRWALRRVDEGRAQDSDYLLRHLAAHLADADERRAVLARLMLARFDWLQARLALSGVEALLADAEHLRGHPGHGLLLSLLRNSAQVLRVAPAQFVAQVLGRVGGGPGPDPAQALATLAHSALQWLADAGQAPLCRELLLPGRRSLRLSSAQLAICTGGPGPLVVLPDGRIAFVFEDDQVRLWDPAGAVETITFEGHSDAVTALAALPDGRIASGARDTTVRLWDPARPTVSTILAGHSRAVFALAVLPDGRLASGSMDKSVRLWDVHGSAEPVVLDGHSDWVTALAVLPDGRIASGCNDYTVRLRDPARPDSSLVFANCVCDGDVLAVLPDGRIVIAATDDTVRVVDPARPAEPVMLTGHQDWVRALVVLADGHIASGGRDGLLRLWDPRRPSEPVCLEGHAGVVEALAALPDGRIAAGFNDNTVRLWDPLRPAEPVVFEGHSGTVDVLAVLPGGRFASGAQDGTVRVWDAAHGTEAMGFDGHSRAVTALVVLPDGRIASGSIDGTLRLWAPAGAAAPVVFEGHAGGVNALALLPDGRLASGADDGTVRLWDPAGLAAPVILDTASSTVEVLAVLSDGRIAAGSADGSLRLWDPVALGEPVRLAGHAQRVFALAVLPDGRLASASMDASVRLWDPARPAETTVLAHTGWVVFLAVLPDGRLVSGCQWGENPVRLWDPARPLAPVLPNGPMNGIAALAVLPDGRIACGPDDGPVGLWDPARPHDPVVIFEGPAGGVSALAVLPDGRIASGAHDHTVRLWDPARRQPTRVFFADAAITCLAVTPAGLIVAGCADGAVHFLHPAGRA